jgi:ribosome-binding protein aMBF1 (putative translation factor)
MSKEFQKIRKCWLSGDYSDQEIVVNNSEYRLSLALIEARIDAGLTQREVAKRMGMSVSTVSRLESGNIPEMRQLDALAKALNCRLEVGIRPLYSWDDDSPLPI